MKDTRELGGKLVQAWAISWPRVCLSNDCLITIEGVISAVYTWFETEFFVFQSTQKGTVLMGGRFGCN